MRRPNKYKAQRTTVDGRTFDSKAEAHRWLELRVLERAGQIRDLQPQVSIPLTCGGRPVLMRSPGYPNGRRATYRADFTYTDTATGEKIVEDVKGVQTPVFKLKRAMIEAELGVVIQVRK